jgi:hypothetical protein
VVIGDTIIFFATNRVDARVGGRDKGDPRSFLVPLAEVQDPLIQDIVGHLPDDRERRLTSFGIHRDRRELGQTADILSWFGESGAHESLGRRGDKEGACRLGVRITDLRVPGVLRILHSMGLVKTAVKGSLSPTNPRLLLPERKPANCRDSQRVPTNLLDHVLKGTGGEGGRGRAEYREHC